MKVITDIDIELTPRDIARCQSPGGKTSHDMMESFQKAVQDARSLAEPLIAYSFFDVSGIDKENITLKDEQEKREYPICIGPNANMLDRAGTIMAVAHSIGPAIDERVKELNQNSLYLEGYLLDFAGLSALNHVGRQARIIAEDKAARNGWGVTASLSPGSLEGWEVSGQKSLHELLHLDKTGIEITESCMLVPFKTVISIIGIGPGYTSKKVGSICRLCSLRETCLQRRD